MMNKEYYKKICEKLQDSVPKEYEKAAEKTAEELGWSTHNKEAVARDLQ